MSDLSTSGSFGTADRPPPSLAGIKLRISEGVVDPDWTMISVFGELDLAGVGLLQMAIESAEKNALIDLRGCSFMDSSAIAEILSAHRRFSQHGRRLLACSPTAQVRRLLSIVGLLERGIVFDSAEEALADCDQLAMIVCTGCGRCFATEDGPGMVAAIKGSCPECGGRFRLAR